MSERPVRMRIDAMIRPVDGILVLHGAEGKSAVFRSAGYNKCNSNVESSRVDLNAKRENKGKRIHATFRCRRGYRLRIDSVHT